LSKNGSSLRMRCGLTVKKSGTISIRTGTRLILKLLLVKMMELLVKTVRCLFPLFKHRKAET